MPAELYCLWIALLLDLLLGDPPNGLHPVAWIGRGIGTFQRLAPKSGRWKPALAGTLFVAGGTTLAILLGLLWEFRSGRLPRPGALVAEALLLKLMFSVRGLSRAGEGVRRALAAGDRSRARARAGRHLVSRETSTLDEPQLAAATIESLAENTSDSIVAPLLYYSLAGLPGVFAYRFINTCDAMLGYRNGAHEWLGKPAARMDDLANIIPARLTAGLLIAAGACLGSSPLRSAAVWRRHAGSTASPNAGHPMSAAAGVLGVTLEKERHYRLGDGLRTPDADDIGRALRLLWATTALAGLLLSFVLFLVRQR